MARKDTEATARDIALDLCAILDGDRDPYDPFGSDETSIDAVQRPIEGISSDTIYLTLSDGTAWSVRVERYEDAS